MNIFLMVLKELIGIELTNVISKQTKKSKGYGYNHQLSADQSRIISELNKKIILFTSSSDDKTIATEITKLLDQCHESIRETRGEHKADKDSGEAISSLRNLKSYVPEFYSKLCEFKFSLLNKPYTETPDGIVYYHAALYLGEQIFSPKKMMDTEIRAEKEKCLCKRLQQLSDLIKPGSSFAERKRHTLTVLHDLARDNEDIIKKANSSTYVNLPLAPVTGLSFFSAKVNLAEVLGCSLGRFSEQFKEAIRKINKMSEQSFDSSSTLIVENNADRKDPPNSSEHSDSEHTEACVI